MNILGISAFYHDSAAALLKDDKIIACVQEERFTRKKHDASFPIHAIEYCCKQGEVEFSQIDFIVFYDKPFLKFERLLETYLAFAPKGFQSFKMALPLWLKEKLFQKTFIRKQLKKHMPHFDWQNKLLFSEHHLSHAASAFFPSPFEKSLVLTMDGVGEWATTSVAIGHGNKLEMVKEIHFPHSLGLFYSAFTYFTGFKVNSGEYKLMGLAPYGNPCFKALIEKEMVDVKEDGSFRLNMDYFDYCVGLTMTNDKFSQLFGIPVRKAEEPLQQIHMDIAASVQAVLETIIIKLCSGLAKEYQIKNICLAGGVALNCVANGKLLREKIFDNIWIQPASGDAGGALGAALCATYLYQGTPRSVNQTVDHMQGSYLGPAYQSHEIETALQQCDAVYHLLADDELISTTVSDLADDKAIGWFQGRMEFGPRALGNRSIIANPASINMQSVLNLKVKYRESFRPFAPSVLAEDVQDWFELDKPSPYMLLVANVAEAKRNEVPDSEKALFGIEKLKVARSAIPAVTHVDYSARVQTVHQETNPRYHQLISAFKQKTGVPILVNTSFNVRGEPIVCTPKDAFRCFMGTELDTLVIGNYYLRKSEQKPELRQNYQNQFELD